MLNLWKWTGWLGGQDKRATRRFPAHMSVRVDLQGGDILTGTIQDLSRSGVRVHLDGPLIPSERVELEWVAGTRQAVCRWTSKQPEGWVMGLEFEPTAEVRGPAGGWLLRWRTPWTRLRPTIQ